MRATATRATVRSVPPPMGQDGKPLAFKEPFSYGRTPPPEAYGKDEVWVPEERGDLIDRLPRHPNADQPPTFVKA